jgi:hypothetical protein|tara:strand:- start:2957 stop:3250 length:294 start_codon:yes stop_codon:yes gene_type:complete
MNFAFISEKTPIFSCVPTTDALPKLLSRQGEAGTYKSPETRESGAKMLKRPDMKPLQTPDQYTCKPEGPFVFGDPLDHRHFLFGTLCELLTIWTTLK